MNIETTRIETARHEIDVLARSEDRIRSTIREGRTMTSFKNDARRLGRVGFTRGQCYGMRMAVIATREEFYLGTNGYWQFAGVVR